MATLYRPYIKRSRGQVHASREDTEDNSARALFRLQEAIVSSSGMCRNVHPLLDVVHQAFLPPTTVLPTLHCALEDGFGEAVVA